MSLPRNISVKKMNDRWVMVQSPAASLKKQRTSPVQWEKRSVDKSLAVPGLGNAWEMELQLTVSAAGKTGIRLGSKEKPAFMLFYDPSVKQIILERGAGNQFKLAAFEKLNRFAVPFTPTDRKISLRVFFDNSIIEVYINDGDRVFTAQVFPEEKNSSVDIFSEGTGAILHSLKAWKLKTIW
jgi:sucrose-6-phosphate hydrolase SacC (GH32 family)